MGSATVTRVLVTGPSLQGEGAGIQQHVRYVVQAFANSPRIEIVPFAVTSSRYREPWSLKAVRLLGVYLRFPRAAAACDVVHLNSTIDRRSVIRDAGLAMLALAVGRPVVVQFHGGGLHRLSGPTGMLARFLGRSFRHARAILFLSEDQGRPVAEALGLERVEYVCNYLDDESFHTADETCSTELRIAFLGRLDEPKGATEVVEAVLQSGEAGWRLRVAGVGPTAGFVSSWATRDPRIEYLGFVDEHRRLGLLGWADVLCLPSAHDEGFPYAVLEAAAAGTALVTSDKGALLQLNIDGETGIVVQARNAEDVLKALRRLDHDRELLAAMKARAASLVHDRFGFDVMRTVFTRIWSDAASEGTR